MALETDGQRRWFFAHLGLSAQGADIDSKGARALRSYKNFGFSMVNKRLREKTTGLGEGADRDADTMARDLDHALSQSELRQNIVVFRGFEHPAAAKHPEQLVGRVLDSPAFLSTSFDREVVHERFMQSEHSVGLRLHVPKGTKAVATDKFSDLYEAEVLLQRGIKARVKGVTYYKGKPYLDAEVVR